MSADIETVTSIDYSNPYNDILFRLKIRRYKTGYQLRGNRMTGLLNVIKVSESRLSQQDAITKGLAFASAARTDNMLTDAHLTELNDLLLSLT